MKKLYVFVLLIAFVAVSCNKTTKDGKMPITTKSESALALYKEARAAFEDVNLPVGLDKLNNAVTDDSDFFMANFYLSLYYLDNKEKFDEYANAAINSKAKLSKAEELLKSSLPKLIENQKADVTDVGKKLVEMYPKDVWAYWFLFTFQNIINDQNGCAETLSKALEITDNPAPVYNMLGYVYLRLGKNDEAGAAFNKYLELAPTNPNAYDSMGDYFMNVKEYGKAYDSYMKAHSIDSVWSYEKALKAKQLADSLEMK
jgi:tetratricopeptide (TPR) repeat protein